jgi:hypothetical protein
MVRVFECRLYIIKRPQQYYITYVCVCMCAWTVDIYHVLICVFIYKYMVYKVYSNNNNNNDNIIMLQTSV